MRKIFYIHFWLIIIYFLKNIFIKNYPKIMALEESSKLRWWIFIHQSVQPFSPIFKCMDPLLNGCLLVQIPYHGFLVSYWLCSGWMMVWWQGLHSLLPVGCPQYTVYGSPNRITRVHIHNMFEHWKDSVQSFYLFHLLFFIYRLF